MHTSSSLARNIQVTAEPPQSTKENRQRVSDDSGSKRLEFAISLPEYPPCAANDAHVVKMAQHTTYPNGMSVAAFEMEPPRQKLTTHSLHWIMCSVPLSQIPPDQQLTLAVRLAEAVLQYHATPWLNDHWRLDRIFLEVEDPLEDYHLETLHLMLDQGKNAQTPHAIDGTGVMNKAIFDLGIALLEIAFWQPLESAHNFHSYGIVKTAHRLALSPSPLGPRYGKMIQNCLAYGHTREFSNQMLQHHIASRIIEPLQANIAAISL